MKKSLIRLAVLALALPLTAAAAPPELAPMDDASAFLADAPHGAVTAILGVPQTGKSRVAKTTADAGGFSGLVVFDPYARRDLARANAGLPVSPWSGLWVTPREFVLHPREVFAQARGRPVIIAPHSLDKYRLAAEFTACAKVLFAFSGHDFLAEEVGLYGREATDAIMMWASGSGHADGRLFLSCQSLGRVQKDGRRHVTRVVAFAQGEPEDLDALKVRCGPEFARAVAQLDGPPHPSPPRLWKLGQGLKEHYS